MFILASKSPRRQELMKMISSDFRVVSSKFDESTVKGLSVKNTVLELAKGKGEVVYKSYPNDIVISADTIVTIDEQIIGKPKDETDARRILKLLSARKHIVYTAYAIFFENKIITNTIESEVYFNKLSDELIEAYLKTGSPFDKAGAYGIQDNNEFHLISKIKGSYHNIVGFPVEEIIIDLKKNKIL